MKKPKSDGFQGKVCSVFLVASARSGCSLPPVGRSGGADGSYRAVNGTDFQLETSVNFEKILIQ